MPNILLVGQVLLPNGSYTPPATYHFQRVLAEVGLRTKDVTICRPNELIQSLRTHRPHIIVACGDVAAAACVPKWAPESHSAERMRGYFFEGVRGIKTLVTICPSLIDKTWQPWRTLLSCDLQRAREHASTPTLSRPVRNVHVVRDRFDAKRRADDLIASRRIAFDIEISDVRTTACVGFATSPESAVVFPARFMSDIERVLTSDVPKIAQNGQFDAYFLWTRNNIRVRALTDDTLLAWHACYPELAGTKLDFEGKRKGIRRTHKSLAFFASLYTLDAWWKDYKFKNDDEMYTLNGRDCCITFDVMQHLDALIARQQVEETYRLETRLIWPVVTMLSRGLHVDETLRQERVRQLTVRIDNSDDRINMLLKPFLEERLASLDPRVAALFQNRTVCKCCRNASKKRIACWSCADFTKAPSKKQLGATQLGPCIVCKGEGSKEWLWFNPRSVDQKRAMLYDVLGFGKKFSDGKLSTDEDALKALLAQVA